MNQSKIIQNLAGKSFGAGLFSRRGMLCAAAVLLAGAAVCLAPGANAAAAGTNSSDRVVVMISVDGLAGFYFDDPKAEMPAIRALATNGAYSSRMKASTPTVTWPNHTTLVTGVNPAKHGVVGNNYLDRATGKHVALIWDPNFDKDEIVKVPTIYDLAKSNGLKTAAVRWPASRGAKTLDWTIPDMDPTKGMVNYATPSLLADVDKAGIPFKPSANAKDNPTEETYTKIANLILRDKRPNLLLFHILEVDHTQHGYGPRSPEAYHAIKEADACVAEVWEELKRDYPGRATLLVVSDHGFSPINRILYPKNSLRKAGLDVSNKPKAPIHIVNQGGSAFVYIQDETNRARLVDTVRQALKDVKGVSKIVGVEEFKDYGVANPKDDPHAPDLILFADEGCSFGDTADGSLAFNDKPERRGSHGQDANLPNLHATFVAWGEGVKPGVRLGEISNVSVAPTIAELLAVSMPGAEGKPLREVLKQPSH
jgi:predicted AlkP superfamily pyrophosphatase or phosphodiesterase